MSKQAISMFDDEHNSVHIPAGSAARNATHQLAQDFATNYNLLLLTQKALTHYTPLEMHVLSLRAMVEQPVTPTSSSPVAPHMASHPHCT
jgi:hypothetical protein